MGILEDKFEEIKKTHLVFRKGEINFFLKTLRQKSEIFLHHSLNSLLINISIEYLLYYDVDLDDFTLFLIYLKFIPLWNQEF